MGHCHVCPRYRAGVNPAPALASAPVVAHVVRNGFVESVHHGIAAVVDTDGTVLRQVGDATAPIFPRSSNKPMQALAMLRAGASLDGALLALADASHSGEQFHREGVRSILGSVGLSTEDLQNTPGLPLSDEARIAWLRAGHGPESITQNCSGKHAGMLAACVAAGWDTATYRDPQHPLQRLTAETIGELTGEKVAAVGVDGCGAPVMAVSTAGLARAFARLATAPADTLEGRVAGAIRDYPQYLGGTGRDVTELIRGVPGLVAKDGAEAVYAVGLADGRGVAVKITDGGSRARSVVLAELLRSIGVDLPGGWGESVVLGHGDPVGRVEPVGL